MSDRDEGIAGALRELGETGVDAGLLRPVRDPPPQVAGGAEPVAGADQVATGQLRPAQLGGGDGLEVLVADGEGEPVRSAGGVRGGGRVAGVELDPAGLGQRLHLGAALTEPAAQPQRLAEREQRLAVRAPAAVRLAEAVQDAGLEPAVAVVAGQPQAPFPVVDAAFDLADPGVRAAEVVQGTPHPEPVGR